MSTSPERIAANAANAQLSTGPRTEEGKARSSQNARTHGLTARDLAVAPEERQEFDQMLQDFQASVQPYDAVQQTLFDEMVAAAWNLRRIRRMETALCAGKSYDEQVADEIQTKLDRLYRHRTRLDRIYHRNLKELKALHTNTVIAATLPYDICDNMPPLGSANEIAKRSQEIYKSQGYRWFADRLNHLRSRAISEETATEAAPAPAKSATS